MELFPDDYSRFVVIGNYAFSTRKFRSVYSGGMQGAKMAFGINLWRGRVWGYLKNGKRKLLKRVTN